MRSVEVMIHSISTQHDGRSFVKSVDQQHDPLQTSMTCGVIKGRTELKRFAEYLINLLPELKMEVIPPDDSV